MLIEREALRAAAWVTVGAGAMSREPVSAPLSANHLGRGLQCKVHVAAGRLIHPSLEMFSNVIFGRFRPVSILHHSESYMRILIVIASLAMSSAALAGPECTTKPSSTWLTEAAMKEKVAASGHRIEVFKTTKGNCYEIYGRSPDGKRVEIYYNPVDGEVVRSSSR